MFILIDIVLFDFQSVEGDCNFLIHGIGLAFEKSQEFWVVIGLLTYIR